MIHFALDKSKKKGIDISDNCGYNLKILYQAENCLSLREGDSIMTNMNMMNPFNHTYSAISGHSVKRLCYHNTFRRSAN